VACMPANACRLRRPDYGSEPRPPLSAGEKVGLWSLGIIAFCVVMVVILHFDKRERDEWRADWKRRTELCEAQGGIPRYQVRGRSYDGCDFPPRQQ
jgi:hypothetical protein